jgi:hypothetical protein
MEYVILEGGDRQLPINKDIYHMEDNGRQDQLGSGIESTQTR